MEQIGRRWGISGGITWLNFTSRNVTYADVEGGTRAQIWLHQAWEYGNCFLLEGGSKCLSDFGGAVSSAVCACWVGCPRLPARCLQPAVGINIPTLPFNFNCWAFNHTQTLPHIEGFTNTAVTKTSSSHRGIHQLLLMQFHKQQNSLPLNRGIHLKLCLRAPSSWQRDLPHYAEKHLPLDKWIHHDTVLKSTFLLIEGFTTLCWSIFLLT